MRFCNMIRAFAVAVLIANSATASESNDNPFRSLNEKAYYVAVASITAMVATVAYALAWCSAEEDRMRRDAEAQYDRMKAECESCMEDGGTAHQCCGWFM